MLTPKQKEEVDGNGKEGSSEEKGGRKERDKEGRSEEVRLLPLNKVRGWKGGSQKCLSPFLHITRFFFSRSHEVLLFPLSLDKPVKCNYHSLHSRIEI